MKPLLQVQGLEVVYHTQKGQLKALHEISFDLLPGEIVGIVGESGCGKSTVASALLRLLPPNGQITAGRLVFKGRDLLSLTAEELRQLRGRDLAMIFQDPMTSLNPVFTIGTQILDVERAHQASPAPSSELLGQAVASLNQVGIPDAAERVKHFPHQFSGGMQQRIMIAMALTSKPALLIADESTSALDVTLEAQILELLKELRQLHQTSILFISHDLGVIAQLCDRVIVMYAGRIVEQGEVLAIFEQPQHPYTQALLASVPSRRHHGRRLATIPGLVPSLSALPPGCKFADRCPQAQPLCHQAEPRYLGLDNRHVRCHAYDPAAGYAPPALPPSPAPTEPGRTSPEPAHNGSGELLVKLDNVSTYFYDHLNVVEQLLRRERGAIRAVDGVSMKIRRGEVIGLVGESGSGKTTLGKTILQLAPASAGQITFAGQDITRLAGPPLRRLRRRMQMIFQDPYASLSPRLTVAYLVTEPYRFHYTPPAERYSVPELLAMVGLSNEQATKYPHELSGGQARRVGIARALALRPEFLIADEPTAGLDVSVAASVLNLMKELAQQLGLTYLIITHNLNIVGYISDRVAVMYLGQVVEVGPTAEIFAAPAHPYTLALLSAISEPKPRRQQSGRRLLLSGEIPSPKNPPPGCRFHTRCPFAEARCHREIPLLEEIEPGRQVACHFWPAIRSAEIN
jgi:peptide/nickel transport system ATP-binding protein